MLCCRCVHGVVKSTAPRQDGDEADAVNDSADGKPFQQHEKDKATAAAPVAPERSVATVGQQRRKRSWRRDLGLRHSLSAKLLVLTVLFVMLAEVLIFAPSVARFRLTWLRERLAEAHLAALAVEAAPGGEVGAVLEQKLLRQVGVHAIDLKQAAGSIRMLSEEAVPQPDVRFDLRNDGFLDLIGDAFVALLISRPRVLEVVDTSPKTQDATLRILLPERPLCTALVNFAGRILLLSVIISLITAALVFFSLRWLLIRPMRQITASMVAFREHPQDVTATIHPCDRHDEIGVAQRELADMQASLRAALHQKERLAALGTAVAKINHDLRSILATASLISERLMASDDPEVMRVTPRLLSSLDRAVALCAQTVSYTRDGVLPVRPARVALSQLIEEVGTDVLAESGLAVVGASDGTTATGQGDLAWLNDVPDMVAVWGDRDQISRALINLGRNAVQAGATQVRLSLARRPEGADDREVVLTVADNGPGLPPKARENLFQPFLGSVKPGGAGLGLAIAWEIMRAHRGELRLVQTSAAGTVFALHLPGADKGRR